MSKARFIAGDSFDAGRLIMTRFRYVASGEFIEILDNPVEDRWVYYCRVNGIQDEFFEACLLFLGRKLINNVFYFSDLIFTDTKEGGDQS